MISGKVYGTMLDILITADRFQHFYQVIQTGCFVDTSSGINEDFGCGLERILDGIEGYLSSK